MPVTATRVSSLSLLDTNFPATWYAGPKFGLPPALKEEIGEQPLTKLHLPALDEKYYLKHLVRKLVACQGEHRPCHDEKHASQVCNRAQQVLDALHTLLGDLLFEMVFPLGLRQALMLGLASHDNGHTGTRWTPDADPAFVPTMPDGLSGSHEEYSLEYLTSWWNDAEDKDVLPLGFRVISTFLVWASSNGGETALGKQMEIDTVEVNSFLGWLMRAVDLTFSDDFVLNTHFETKLMWVESIGVHPTSTKGLIENRKGFLRHVEQTYAMLDDTVRWLFMNLGVPSNISITEFVGWRGNLKEAWHKVRQLEAGDPLALAIMKTAHTVHGVELKN
jgi:hypothetical protein